ncbi:MAG: hypothetical protein GF309_04435 [Candidatus Lokiarchaeota archaeon]|nr:hypothetical protein [Candidatus Lokiarchaeota archaeon]
MGGIDKEVMWSKTVTLFQDMKHALLSISIRYWIVYTLGSAVAIIFSSRLSAPNWAGTFGAAYYAATTSATIYILGIPFILSSALFMTALGRKDPSEDGQQTSLSEMADFPGRILSLYLLNFAVMFIWTCISFEITLSRYSHISFLSLLPYMPAAILAASITSCFVTILTAGITTALDDWRLALACNFFLFFAMMVIFGTVPDIHSETGLPLWSLYHLHRFLAIAFASGIPSPTFPDLWTNPYTSAMIFGIPLAPVDLIAPVAAWSILSLLLLLGTHRAHTRSVRIWYLRHTEFYDEQTEISGEQQPPTNERTVKSLQNTLQTQRQLVAACLILFVVFVPMVNGLIATREREESIHILYQSPSGGERLNLDVWRYGSIQFGSPPAGEYNWYSIEVEILNWHDSPEEVKCYRILSQISIDTFESLNKSERDALASGSSTISKEYPGSVGGFYNLGQNHGTYLWGIMFLGSENENATGTLTTKLTVIIRTA